jgi:hypothetical protein
MIEDDEERDLVSVDGLIADVEASPMAERSSEPMP